MHNVRLFFHKRLRKIPLLPADFFMYKEFIL
jgi:hypothetical protein